MDVKASPEETSTSDLSENANDVKKVSKLLYSKHTQDILKVIDYFKSQTSGMTRDAGEEDEEYNLIIQANGMTADIDSEIQTVYKFLRDHYAPRFPELESLVLNPLDYARTVQAIGNNMDITKIDLRPILPSATIMVITVTHTTTSGRELSPEEWKITKDACDMALGLDAARKKIMSYVESRMSIIAPNLSNVVGSSTAAKLLTAAGGLMAFCKIPACNVQVLGSNRKTNTGFSSASMERHVGYIYHSDTVSAVPHDLRKKVAKILAAKCVLAARIDAQHESTDGEQGRKFREDIDHKVEKMQEAAPHKITKALPIPDEGPKKRRGGRRIRKMKEAYAMTELRAARNRMVFGEAEDEVDFGDETEGLGMAAKQIGKIRASVADQRNKVKAPKQKSWNTSGLTSGLASSLSFTPVQGIELIDPTVQAERVKKANEKYFGDGAFSTFKK
ncbi:hypothetical protein PHYBLDRAFT_23225 [Phycomyces blakesleeanus NRRL 1555(-)]|uniref:Nop domain-containing protein n=1 Tax=Phycomyces blakesleeanus (strain ATCC 8743b / DSM 1359 / FGSC 10004 / NBRC 33097 / NRRL 1555) TaxID=763407 RepID=A0A167KDG4_PHYB8|nr:hypothetical protein PHYBLDRAFT_23225 [Phycomyces blakesleeanus NRRL 1555(-)]OAD67835.1 hypothetical protein PHYBLDRAFT_23225 [Phycomyces blakesleeanus NRRL 1555(-)]|eukprot:XP_018285875.1 hypothetical protein PHYBLDRAFT_23225 [Phycomyces blakesleeanus NRRL 1555(-)]